MTERSDGPPTLPRGAEARRSETGLEIVDIETGSGREVAEGRIVRVHYSGWLTNGSLFERTDAAREGIQFRVGAGQVIPAFDEGVLGMRVGGRRRLIVPSDLAYGPRGKPGRVPPFATLIYDVVVVGVA